MTTKDLFSAIGAVDEDVLIQAQRKRISPIVWIVAAAAVLLGITLLIHRERPVYHTTLEEKPSWNMDADILVSPDQILCINSRVPCELEFSGGLAVQAQVIDVLPDTYLVPEKTLNRRNYRVLRMKTVETVIGRNIPNEFWFLLPEQYYTDLGGLDLLINLTQVGVEDYLLFNTTQQQYETFSLMFTASASSHEDDIQYEPDPTLVSIGITLSVLPFREGELSWPDTAQWAREADLFESFSTRETSIYPIAYNTTLEEAKAAIRDCYKNGPLSEYNVTEPFVRYADEYNMGILLTDADTPKEGVFSQIIHQHERKILLCRIIDGFYANECYLYYEDGRIEASDVKFTQEDIAALPNLTPAVEQALAKAPEEGTCRKFVGYYYKTDNGKVFGVVQAHWEINWENTVTVNLVVTPGGTIHQVTAKGLDVYLKGN